MITRWKKFRSNVSPFKAFRAVTMIPLLFLALLYLFKGELLIVLSGGVLTAIALSYILREVVYQNSNFFVFTFMRYSQLFLLAVALITYLISQQYWIPFAVLVLLVAFFTGSYFWLFSDSRVRIVELDGEQCFVTQEDLEKIRQQKQNSEKVNETKELS